jgi:hypothetical protein
LVSHLLDTNVITRVSHAKSLATEALKALKDLVGGANIVAAGLVD